VTVVGPTEVRPAGGLAVDFVVESDRALLNGIVQWVRDGRLQTNIGNVATLDYAVAALNTTERRNGKKIIHVRRSGLGQTVVEQQICAASLASPDQPVTVKAKSLTTEADRLFRAR
jgi:hypothetical protein